MVPPKNSGRTFSRAATNLEGRSFPCFLKFRLDRCQYRMFPARTCEKTVRRRGFKRKVSRSSISVSLRVQLNRKEEAPLVSTAYPVFEIDRLTTPRDVVPIWTWWRCAKIASRACPLVQKRPAELSDSSGDENENGIWLEKRKKHNNEKRGVYVCERESVCACACVCVYVEVYGTRSTTPNPLPPSRVRR